MNGQKSDVSKDQLPFKSFEYPIPSYCVFECAANVFRFLIEDVGENRALEAVKKYTKVWGINTANMVKQKYGLKGNEIEDIALAYYYLHFGTSWGHIKPLEIRDGNAVVEIYACPTKQVKNCPPEVCIALSHYIADGICLATNPDYEFVYTHHIANGDDRCRYIVKKKSSKVDLNNPGTLQKSIPLNLSEDEILKIAGGVCYASINIFTMTSIDLIGSQKTLERALPQARETGNNVGKFLMGGSDEKGDIHTIGEKLDFFGSIWGHIGTPARINGFILEKEITECPCKGSPIEVCKQFEALSNGICEAINPEYEFKTDRRMSEGEANCHWVVRKKMEPTVVKSTEIVNFDDPAEKLAMRFTKGEISKNP